MITILNMPLIPFIKIRF